MSIELNDGYNVLYFADNLKYKLNFGKKKLNIKLKILDMVVCEIFYYNCRIYFLRNYVRKYYNIENFKLKHNDVYLLDYTLCDYNIKDGDTINIEFNPNKIIYFIDKSFYNIFGVDLIKENYDININNLCKFMRIKNMCSYYGLKLIKMSGEETEYNYFDILKYFNRISKSELEDYIKIVMYFSLDKYNIFLGNILNYLFYSRKLLILKDDFDICENIIHLGIYNSCLIKSPIEKIDKKKYDFN